jgi:hypothetical protein
MGQIGTLGPSGTCSEDIAYAYIQHKGWELHDALRLFTTFEDAIDSLYLGEVDRVIVPAAYSRYNEIVFRHTDWLAVREVLYSKTPAFVLAARSGFDRQTNHHPLLACHKAPSPLLAKLNFEFEFLEVTSNAVAAQKVKDGEASLCITNERALNFTNLSLAPKNKLCVLEYFGSVEMVWIVFEKKRTESLESFWIGCIHDTSISNFNCLGKALNFAMAQ